MKISYNWLKDYLKFSQSPEEVAEILTLTGLEVEEIHQSGTTLDGVVVGEVLSVIAHPNADRLRVCQVNTGSETVQIVCGAPNVAAGQKVAVATVGSVLPLKLEDGSNLVIKKSKIRGEVSEGMICAEDELGLGSNHDGIMVLDTNIEVGTDAKDIFDINLDYIFEIGLTPNRPDASCHLGVARDLAAVINKPLTKPYKSLSANLFDGLKNDITVEIHNTERCHRYVGILIKNVTVGESPDWLQQRLKNIGLRPINNIVDATNYVLHELGQPLHAFDFDLIEGKKIVVQSFDKETKFTTLDGVERAVPSGSLFICDGKKPVALAGIMGGMNSEININTKNVFIESAYFEPVGVRKTSKTLSLQTDSSYRFERGIDPEITYAAARRCAEMIADLAGGVLAKGHIDNHPVKYNPTVVRLRISRLNKIIGMEFRTNQAISVLRSLEFEVKKHGNDVLECTVPTFRPDVTTEIDLIEEIARIFDYNKIPNPDYIQFSRPEPLSFRETFQEKVKSTLVELGYREIYANSLLPEPIALIFAKKENLIYTLNPISRDTAVLRPSLIPGFIRSASFNFNRNAAGVAFFEIGNVFKKSEKGTYHKGIHEETHILIGVGGLHTDSSWNVESRKHSIFDVKGSVSQLLSDLRIYHLVREVSTSSDTIEYISGSTKIGELKVIAGDQKKLFDTTQPLYCAEFSLTKLQQLAEQIPPVKYSHIPKYPGIEFDLALQVNKSIPAGKIDEVIRSTAGKLLRDLKTFDVFVGKSIGESEKSIAFRLFFLDETKTLTIKDVDSIIGKTVKRLEREFQAKLRS
jgi:phenylalanyl-tRNA synthetase beta chain